MENELMPKEQAGFQPVVESKKMNFLQRIIGTIVSPTETMKNLAEKPRILFAILLLLVAPAVGIIIGWPTMENTLRHSFDASLAQQQNLTLTPEMIDSMMGMYKVALPIAVPIIMLVFWFLSTAAYFGVIKLFKGEGKLKQYLSMSGYANIIMLLGSALTLGATSVTGTTLDLSLAVFLPDPSGSFFLGFVKGLLSGFSVFSVWYLWVVCEGFIHVSKLSKKKGYSIVFGLYAILILISALLTGVGTAKL